MVKVIKCENYQQLQKVAEAWGNPEAYKELENPELSFWFPVFAYKEEDGLFVTDSSSSSSKFLEVSIEDYDRVKEVIKKDLVFCGYFGMPASAVDFLGFRATVLYKDLDNFLHTNNLVAPESAFVESLPTQELQRGNVVVFNNNFCSIPDLNGHFGLPEKYELVVTSVSADTEMAKVQVRGTKLILSVHPSILKVTGSIVTFRKPHQDVGSIANFDEEYIKVKALYSECLGLDTTYNFEKILKASLKEKNDYIGFLFNGAVTLPIGESVEDRQIIIKQHPRFKEMLSSLEELGVDTKTQMSGILQNSIEFEGKQKRVTGILQTKLKLRFDDVYTYPQVLFPDSVILSISPFEFATASHNVEDSSRSGDLKSSCFGIEGSYHSAVWAYFQSKQTAILKMKNSMNQTYYRTWVSFDLDNGGIILGRQYGSMSDTQLKMIRYILEKKVSDYLNLPNSWVCHRDFSVYFDYHSSNTYLDSAKYIMINKSLSPSSLNVQLPSGICWDGYESPDGEFDSSSKCCDSCDNYFSDDELTTVHNGDRVCNHCLSEYYRWCDISEEYYPEDDTIYIQDKDVYVHRRYYDRFIYVGGEFYEEIPEGYVMTENGDIIELDNAYCCVFSNEYYEFGEDVQVYFNGYEEHAHKDYVPTDYHKCPECDVYHKDDLQECPNCGYTASSSTELEQNEKE